MVGQTSDMSVSELSENTCASISRLCGKRSVGLGAGPVHGQRAAGLAEGYVHAECPCASAARLSGQRAVGKHMF